MSLIELGQENPFWLWVWPCYLKERMVVYFTFITRKIICPPTPWGSRIRSWVTAVSVEGKILFPLAGAPFINIQTNECSLSFVAENIVCVSECPSSEEFEGLRTRESLETLLEAASSDSQGPEAQKVLFWVLFREQRGRKGWEGSRGRRKEKARLEKSSVCLCEVGTVGTKRWLWCRQKYLAPLFGLKLFNSNILFHFLVLSFPAHPTIRLHLIEMFSKKSLEGWGNSSQDVYKGVLRTRSSRHRKEEMKRTIIFSGAWIFKWNLSWLFLRE